MSNEVVTFESGASRTERRPEYDYIPTVVWQALSARFEAGAKLQGRANYLKGLDDPEFHRQLFNHLIHHLLLWRDGDTSDRHLEASLWNVAVLCQFSALGAPHPWPLPAPDPQAQDGAHPGTDRIGEGSHAARGQRTRRGTGIQPPDPTNQHGHPHGGTRAVVGNQARVEAHQTA